MSTEKLKQKLKLVWRLATVFAVATFFLLIVLLLWIGAEYIAAIILSVVGAVVFWYTVILIAGRLLIPDLSKYIGKARVGRVMDDIEVESTTQRTGDAEFDKYVQDYARARDFWGKTAMLLLVGMLLALLYYVFGDFR